CAKSRDGVIIMLFYFDFW
nr:immunoglobulin heavy chain junction region [Macaca mulatta]